MCVNTEWTGREDGEDVVLERELAVALGRRAVVPEGFAERVLARAAAEVPAEERGRLLRWRGQTGWAGWAVAAGLTVGVLAGGGVWERRQVEQRAEARRCADATAQFETAQRITDQTLDRVRAQMERAGVPADAMNEVVGR